MSKRPVIKIKPVFWDYLLEICSLVILVTIVVLILIQFKNIPNTVPTHFDLKGSAIAYGNKHTIFIPLIAAIVIYTGLTIVKRYPHIYNYPVKITEQNVQRIYKMGIRVVLIIKLLTLILLLFITIKTIFGI